MSQALIELVRGKFPDVTGSSHKGDEVVTVKRESLVEVITYLRNDEPDMKLLRQIACVDLLTFKTETTGGGSLASIEVPAYALEKKPTVEPRYQVAYNLHSITRKQSLRVRVELRSDDVKVPTITGLFRTADWW